MLFFVRHWFKIEICGCLLEDPQCLDLVIVFHPESVCGEMNNEEIIYCFKRLHQNIHLKVYSIHLIFYTNIIWLWSSDHLMVIWFIICSRFSDCIPQKFQISKYRTHLSPLTRSLTGWGDGSGLLVDDALCSCLWRQKKKTMAENVGSSTRRFVKLYAVRCIFFQ